MENKDQENATIALVSNPVNQENDKSLSIKSLLEGLFYQWFPFFISLLSSSLSDFLNTKIVSSNFEAKYIDAVGLWWTITFMICSVPVFGMATAQDTLVAQGSGRKDYKECIRVLFISSISIFTVSIGTSMVLLFGKQGIFWFSSDSEVVDLTSRYLHTIIPDVFIKNQGTLLSMFMFAQLVFIPSMIISITFNLLCPIICYVLVISLNLGYLGVVYAAIIRDSCIMIGNTLYLIFSSDFEQIRIKFRLFFGASWKAYLSLGIPAIFLSILENWSYLLLALFMGRLGTDYLAANVILTNIFSCLFMLPSAIGYAMVALIGNSLGENNPYKARKLIGVGVVKGAILMLIFILPLYFFKEGVAKFCFNQHEKIIAIFLDAFPICLIFSFFETLNTCFQMSLIGMVKQIISSICGIFGYGAFCLIFGYIFVFKMQFKDKGFWMATTLGAIVSMITAIIIILCSNFKKLAQEASAYIEQ